MKTTRVIVVPEHSKTVTDKMICDLCGKESRYDTFNIDNYSVEDIEVRMKSGTAYPESGSGTEVEFHICPNCFTTKLIPWMKSQGAKPTEAEWWF